MGKHTTAQAKSGVCLPCLGVLHVVPKQSDISQCLVLAANWAKPYVALLSE